MLACCWLQLGYLVSAPSQERNFLNLASMAFNAGNFPEAEHYFVSALELNHSNPEAWLGRGLSAGWQSVPGQLRIGDLQYALSQSLSVLPPEQYHAQLQRYADLALDQFQHLIASMDDYAITNACHPGVWEQYVDDMLEFIQAIRSLLVEGVDHTDAYKILAEITRLLITGIAYNTLDGRLGEHRLPSDLRKVLTQLRDDAIQQLSQLDPSFTSREIDKRTGYRVMSFIERLYLK
jgi:tetratricopeptide (TPR) repeat protein